MSLIVDEHREYLSDPSRVGAYREALRAVVRPGDVGVDLASGTGILGLLALRAGAARVYAIESGDIASVARDIATENGFGDRIRIIEAHSSRAVLPERVDFIVTDLAGRFGFEAGLFEVIRDARLRFLKPGGRIIPSAVSLWIAPVESPEVRGHVDFWSRSIEELTFRSAHAVARSTGYPRAFATSDLLAEGVRMTGADLATDVNVMSGSAAFSISRSGTLDGIGGWFSATLAPGVELTNAPGHPDRINRRNVFFPLSDRVTVLAGDRVDVTMVIRPETRVVRWKVAVDRAGTRMHSTDTSTFSGMLISKTGVERTRPDFTPSLTEAGLARRTVVNMCDGRTPVAEIERAVYDRHRQLFTSFADAAAFVAEVVTRYAV
jgi:protein arginine N-methyltransferase 1